MCYDAEKRASIRANLAEGLKQVNETPPARDAGQLGLHERTLLKINMGILSALLSIDERLEMLVRATLDNRERAGSAR